MKRCLVFVPLLLVSGCDLYFGGDDDCQYDEAPGAAIPAQELRDPQTGQCVFQGYDPYTPNGCNGAEYDRAPAVSYDYATCYGFCESLDETTCKATDACRAIYGCRTDVAGVCADPVYAACWGTAPSGPVFGAPCAGLDALECSRHNDCSAVHEAYESCAPGSCTNVLAGFVFCTAEGPPPPPPPPACGTLDERGCIERDDCTPLYEGSDCSCTELGCGCNVWTFVSCGNAV